jgi:hypothetical protein
MLLPPAQVAKIALFTGVVKDQLICQGYRTTKSLRKKGLRRLTPSSSETDRRNSNLYNDFTGH